jgi:hypothetical protein
MGSEYTKIAAQVISKPEVGVDPPTFILSDEGGTTWPERFSEY